MQYDFKPKINGSTQVFGILGHPVAHSLSPLLHNAAFQEVGFNGVYIPFPVADAKAFLDRAHLMESLKGLSVTIPHKQIAASIASQCDQLTKVSKAANTLIRTGNAWTALNTDGPGALKALAEGLGNMDNKTVLVVGYGGSALAIANAILLDRKPPKELLITGRNKDKLTEFIQDISAHRGKTQIASLASHHESIDCIIQTTPLGMIGKDQSFPVDTKLLKKDQVVMDIVYTPFETPFVKEAQKQGCRIVPGYKMFLYQAVLQFEIFTGGQAAPLPMLEELLTKHLYDE